MFYAVLAQGQEEARPNSTAEVRRLVEADLRRRTDVLTATGVEPRRTPHSERRGLRLSLRLEHAGRRNGHHH